jgi:hypothetical protein
MAGSGRRHGVPAPGTLHQWHGQNRENVEIPHQSLNVRMT